MEENRQKMRLYKENIRMYGGVILKAYLCAYLFTHVLFLPVYVEGRSMDPSIRDGTIGFSNIAARHMIGIQRFDIVLIQRPNEEVWIKRVIALPNETIEIKNHILYIDGIAYAQPFLPSTCESEDFGPVKVEDDHVFVMGDHRQDSLDSRSVGSIPLSSIKSKDLYPLPLPKEKESTAFLSTIHVSQVS